MQRQHSIFSVFFSKTSKVNIKYWFFSWTFNKYGNMSLSLCKVTLKFEYQIYWLFSTEELQKECLSKNVIHYEEGVARELITNWWVFSKVTFMNTFVICTMLLKKENDRKRERERERQRERSCWAPGIYLPEWWKTCLFAVREDFINSLLSSLQTNNAHSL